MSKKVQVQFDAAALEVIEKLQQASGASSMSDVIRDALGLYDWACEQVESGYSVGAFRDGSPVKEVVVFRAVRRQSDVTARRAEASSANPSKAATGRR